MNGRFFGKTLSSMQIISLGFVGVILVGTLLLMLPVSSAGGEAASFHDALFTATSAVCVTGLIVKDTATYWSFFGQAVILVLIQIGGLGVVSVAALIAMISGKNISLLQRSMLQETISAPHIGGIVTMTGFLFKIAFAFEFAGAILLMPIFCKSYGISGVWMSVFHSVSAFCNAGFDVMGTKTGAFTSLTGHGGNPWIVLIIGGLIVVGGIGFLTWDDISENKLHFKKYRVQSKAILAATAILIAVPTALFFFEEFSALPMKERICLSLFQAITPRTAGFNTIDLSAMGGVGHVCTAILMLIGGSPGSTAGGMKTTTLVVLVATANSVFRRKKDVELFDRRIEDSVVRSAATLMLLYLTLPGISAMAISLVEHLPIGMCLFETVSAIGTVGITLGITPTLGAFSRAILILLMFWGRVGGLTLMYAAISSRVVDVSQSPVEKIIVG